jgi:hypothetical protein
MKKFSKINESSDDTKDIEITIVLKMSKKTADNLEGYYDCNSPESAITGYLQELHELDGVDIDIKVSK